MVTDRFKERVAQAIAWRLPESIVYWSAIRLGAHATTGVHSHTEVPSLTFMDALHRWDGHNKETSTRG